MIVLNSFSPLDQSSGVMTLTEMQEREAVCSPVVSSKRYPESQCLSPEDKIARPQPQHQSLRLFSQFSASLVLFPLPLHTWLTGTVETRREYTPKQQYCQPGVPQGRQLLSTRLQRRVVSKDSKVSLDQCCPEEFSTVMGIFYIYTIQHGSTRMCGG